jgi:DtxR family Mn-dependent transcriptional regulator
VSWEFWEVVGMRDLIDTTEMYLRTVFELEEEGIAPLRARLVERLHLSAPAVSETCARLEQEGLLHLSDKRELEFTDAGRDIAVSVMRKHRLVERLLTDVIGVEWGAVHAEACRWEHVISDEVEQRLVDLLHRPDRDPHGNPIPGLALPDPPDQRVAMDEAAATGGAFVITRISEHLQADIEAMKQLRAEDLLPGVAVTLRREADVVVVEHHDGASRLDEDIARFIYVRHAEAA